MGAQAVASMRGDGRAAARLCGALSPHLPTLRHPIPAELLRAWESMIAVVRDFMGHDIFAASAQDGASLSWDDALHQAIAVCRAATEVDPEPRRAPSPPHRSSELELTEREVDVLRLIAAGDTNKEVAAAAGISAKTMMHHSVHEIGLLPTKSARPMSRVRLPAASVPMDRQFGVLSEPVEVGVVVHDRHLVPNAYRRDEAVDGPSDRHPVPAGRTVQLRRPAEVVEALQPKDVEGGEALVDETHLRLVTNALQHLGERHVGEGDADIRLDHPGQPVDVRFVAAVEEVDPDGGVDDDQAGRLWRDSSRSPAHLTRPRSSSIARRDRRRTSSSSAT
jgi:Bacterial regulatory proteins, luxR family